MKAEDVISRIGSVNSFKKYGKVTRVVGLMIESQGPESSIGDVCWIHVGTKSGLRKIQAEVVGFQDQNVILMPYTNIQEIAPGSLVEATGKPLEIKVGPQLVGSVIDSLGVPLDGSALPKGLSAAATEQTPPTRSAVLRLTSQLKWEYGRLTAF